MIHESNEVSKIVIKEVNLTFNDIYEKPYFPKEYADEIKQANALIIPYDGGFKGYKEPLFPEETREFYYYIKEASQKTVAKFDICASDEQFQELELHADAINIPMMILTYGVLPVATGLITNYISEKVRFKRRDEPKIKVDLIIESEGKSKLISYEGDADKFEDTIKAVKLLDE